MWIQIAIVAAILWYFYTLHPLVWQTASSGASYRVKRGPGQEAVADRLDLLSGILRDFLRRATTTYPHDERLLNIQNRWSGKLAEVESPGDVAYSLSKNDIHVCVRTSDTGLQDVNTSIYVLLHELAHVATDSFGHTREFWLNFRWLLEVAEQLDVYTYQDFDRTKVTFCGHDLGNNVMRCVKNKTCRSLL